MFLEKAHGFYNINNKGAFFHSPQTRTLDELVRDHPR
jgi:hypothetical protein